MISAMADGDDDDEDDDDDDDDERYLLDLSQFTSVEDAILSASDSRVYENEIRELIEQCGSKIEWTLALMFAQSSVSRLRAFHEGALQEITAENPHAAFTLIRSLAETVMALAWAIDHPDFVDRLMRSKTEQPKDMRPPQIWEMREHIAPDAPGFDAVYAQLCELTHFGSLSFVHSHLLVDEEKMVSQWAAAPRWRRDAEPLIACAWLNELRGAGVVVLHNYVARHILNQA
jgi:hypothetical protein